MQQVFRDVQFILKRCLFWPSHRSFCGTYARHSPPIPYTIWFPSQHGRNQAGSVWRNVYRCNVYRNVHLALPAATSTAVTSIVTPTERYCCDVYCCNLYRNACPNVFLCFATLRRPACLLLRLVRVPCTPCPGPVCAAGVWFRFEISQHRT